MVSNIFYFHPYLGKIPILTSIFFKWVETTKQKISVSNQKSNRGFPHSWEKDPDLSFEKVAALAAATKREELLKTKFEFPRCPEKTASRNRPLREGWKGGTHTLGLLFSSGFTDMISHLEMVVSCGLRGCRWVDFLGRSFLNIRQVFIQYQF